MAYGTFRNPLNRFSFLKMGRSLPLKELALIKRLLRGRHWAKHYLIEFSQQAYAVDSVTFKFANEDTRVR